LRVLGGNTIDDIMPIADLRYSRKGATSKAWARSESTNDGRARQPKWKRAACCVLRAAGDRESWAAEGRGRALGRGEHNTRWKQNKAKAYCRREPDAPCRDERIVASLFAIKICMQYDVRAVCHVHRPAPQPGCPALQAPTVTAASSAEFLGGPAGKPDVVHRRQCLRRATGGRPSQ
jgi:hypothetical protein